MANPQLANGYTPFANELLEAIYKSKLSGTEKNIILVVARYTYGFKRKSHKLSTSFLAKALETNARWVKKSLKSLVDANVIIVVNPKVGVTSELMINKNYEEWKCLTSVLQATSDLESTSVLQATAPVTNKPLVPVSSKTPKKENIKENYKEKNIYEDFFESIWKLYPIKKGKGQISKTKKQALQRIGYEQIKRCVDRFVEDMESSKRDKKYWMHGSTFFNSGYVDYLDENYGKGDSEDEYYGFKLW